ADGVVAELSAKPGQPVGMDETLAVIRPEEGVLIDNRLDEEHEALRKTVAEFARDEVAPVIGGFYEREEFPYEIVAKMGRMGLFGLPVAEEYGGMGGDYFALCLALKEIARGDSSVPITLA